MRRPVIQIAVTLCAGLATTLCSVANPIMIQEREQRPSILVRENLVIAVSADHSTITGSFVFATSQTDKSKHRAYSDFYKGYLCVPVYVSVDQTNAAEIASLVAMTVSCDNQQVATRVISGTPLVSNQLQKNCPKELRIVWFAAKLNEKFLTATHKEVSISYSQRHFVKDGKVLGIYTPMLPVTQEVLKTSSIKEIEEYKAWYEITVQPDAGITIELLSTHSIPPVNHSGVARICPIDFEQLLFTVRKGKKAEQ